MRIPLPSKKRPQEIEDRRCGFFRIGRQQSLSAGGEVSICLCFKVSLVRLYRRAATTKNLSSFDFVFRLFPIFVSYYIFYEYRANT